MIYVPLALALAGAAYLSLALFAAIRFARRRVPASCAWTPRVTVLKPVYGDEPGLYENLASFCDQEYSDFEIVFCLHSERDTAHPVVERVLAAYPKTEARIVLGEDPALANPKIANLAKPGAEPTGELVVIADSDIRVDRDYLRAIAASFSNERTGAITCLYGAMPNASLASRLGSLHIEDEFAPSVLVALVMGPLRFCMGATMAARRSALEAIGGIAALGTHLADDHALGELVAAQGYEIELSRYVVRTEVPETTLAELWSHELRWARTNLSLAPAGYFFSFVMYATPFALLYLLLSRNLAAGLPLLALLIAQRLALHAVGRATFGGASLADVALIPLRDLLSLAVWLASLFGRTVSWRGVRYLNRGRAFRRSSSRT